MNSNYRDFVNTCIAVNICLCVNECSFTCLERCICNNKQKTPIKNIITKLDSHCHYYGLLFVLTPSGNTSIVLLIHVLPKLKNVFVLTLYSNNGYRCTNVIKSE